MYCITLLRCRLASALLSMWWSSKHSNNKTIYCFKTLKDFITMVQKMSKSLLGLSHGICFFHFQSGSKATIYKWVEKVLMEWVGSTSGARYSGVPQNVFMVASLVMPSLHRPKSVILMWPSLSSIRFSSCKNKCNSNGISKACLAICGIQKGNTDFMSLWSMTQLHDILFKNNSKLFPQQLRIAFKWENL